MKVCGLSDLVIMHGMNDRIVPYSNSLSIADIIEKRKVDIDSDNDGTSCYRGANLTFNLLQHCGHIPHEEVPDRFNEILGETSDLLRQVFS